MASLFSDKLGGQSHLGRPELFGPQPSHPIPPPPSFADFRFTTIGQEPELLKRISVPGPDFQYNDDRASPTPSLQYPSLTPEPSRLRPSLLQSLTNSNDQIDADMPDASEDMSIDSSLGQQTETMQMDETKDQSPITTGSTNQHSPRPRGWSERPKDPILKAVPIRPSSVPLNTPEQNSTNTVFQAVSQAFSNAKATHHPSTSGAPSHISVTSNNSGTDESDRPSNRSSPQPSAESRYTSLRALQVRLVSALSSLHIPDNSEALLLVQAANSHSANALSTAHRCHVLAQQAVASASEAVSAAQESLSAAEKAKVHASDAVAAVEKVAGGGDHGLKSEWEWKTTISGLQSDLQTLAEWIGEREGEEAAKRREMERMEKAKRDEASVDSAMRRGVAGGLSPQAVQALVDEVVKRTVEKEARSRPTSTETPSSSVQQQQLHRTAELEADDARRAWSLEHGLPARPVVTTRTELPQQTLPSDETRDRERVALIKQAKLKEELRKREEDARLQQEQREAEIRAQRVRELELQKLEVAKFRILERERQAQQENERNAADVLRMRREAEQRKLKDAEVAEAKRLAKAQRMRAHLEEQAKRAVAQTAALKAEMVAREEEAKVARKKEAEARAAEARAAESRAAEVKAAEVKVAEVKAAEAKAAEAKAAEEQAAARAEAREVELRDAQSKKRQEVMAQKQRASAETAARILAERAREKELKEKSVSPVQPRRTPKTPTVITHPLPSPVFQTVPLPPPQVVGQHEAPKTKSTAVSGGVKLGTTEEVPGSNGPPSPQFLRSASLGLRPQKEGRPIPLSLPLPRPKVKHDKVESSTSPASSALFNPGQPSSASAADNLSVHRRSQDPGNLLIIPSSKLPPTSPEAQVANLRFVRDGNGSSRGAPLKIDPATISVKFEPLPQVKLQSPPSGAMKRKVTEEARHALPKRPKVRQDSAPNKKLDKEPQSPAVPSTPVLASTPAPHVSPSNQLSANNTVSPAPITVLSPMVADSLSTTAPIPPRLKPSLPNFRTRKPVGGSVESPSTVHNAASMQPIPYTPYQTSKSSEAPPAEQQTPHERGTSNALTDSNKSTPAPVSTRPNTTHPEPSSVQPNINQANATTPTPQQTTIPNMSRANTAGPNSDQPVINREIAPIPDDDAAQIAPSIHGDGGWDAPAQGDEEMYDASFRGREAPPRYIPRNGDHYSPPARTPPRSLSPPLHYPLSNPQEFYRGPNEYVSAPRRPVVHIPTIPPPRAYTPPLPPPQQSPHLGKRRRWAGDEPPSQRPWQERDRAERSFRSRSPPQARFQQRSTTPERFGGLHSRIGVRDADVYKLGGGESYRPSYPSDPYPPQPRRIVDSYQPPEYAYGIYVQDPRVPLPGPDRYAPIGRPDVPERPDLLERMSAGAPTRGRGAGPRGSGRGRGRGGRALEQRISSNQIPTMTLMNRLEA